MKKQQGRRDLLKGALALLPLGLFSRRRAVAATAPPPLPVAAASGAALPPFPEITEAQQLLVDAQGIWNWRLRGTGACPDLKHVAAHIRNNDLQYAGKLIDCLFMMQLQSLYHSSPRTRDVKWLPATFSENTKRLPATVRIDAGCFVGDVHELDSCRLATWLAGLSFDLMLELDRRLKLVGKHMPVTATTIQSHLVRNAYRFEMYTWIDVAGLPPPLPPAPHGFGEATFIGVSWDVATGRVWRNGKLTDEVCLGGATSWAVGSTMAKRRTSAEVDAAVAAEFLSELDLADLPPDVAALLAHNVQQAFSACRRELQKTLTSIYRRRREKFGSCDTAQAILAAEEYEAAAGSDDYFRVKQQLEPTPMLIDDEPQSVFYYTTGGGQRVIRGSRHV